MNRRMLLVAGAGLSGFIIAARRSLAAPPSASSWLNRNLEEIRVHHPHLQAEDIRAALRFASDHLASEEIVLASGERL